MFTKGYTKLDQFALIATFNKQYKFAYIKYIDYTNKNITIKSLSNNISRIIKSHFKLNITSKNILLLSKPHDNYSIITTTKFLINLSFSAQYFYMSFHKFLSGNLILFLGTSTAGKSSLINCITKKYNNFYLFSRRECLQEYVLQSLYLSAPNEFKTAFNNCNTYKCLQTIYLNLEVKNKSSKVLVYAMQILKEKMNMIHQKEQQLFANKMLYYTLFQSIIPFLQNGQTIIVDSRKTNILQTLLASHFYHVKTINILVYCSYNEILTRLNNRNKIALKNDNLFNARPYLKSLHEFSFFYKATNNKKEAIDIFDQRIIKRCVVTQQLCDEILKKSGKLSLPKNYQDNILQKLSKHFNANPSGYIAPTFPYNFLTNTTKNSTIELFKQLDKTFPFSSMNKGTKSPLLKKETITEVIYKYLTSNIK